MEIHGERRSHVTWKRYLKNFDIIIVTTAVNIIVTVNIIFRYVFKSHHIVALDLTSIGEVSLPSLLLSLCNISLHGFNYVTSVTNFQLVKPQNESIKKKGFQRKWNSIYAPFGNLHISTWVCVFVWMCEAVLVFSVVWHGIARCTAQCRLKV